ncbi:predicted protein [Sclerotinia sclerotiorum 1980 UF-70]|uniref:Uncharacterized protein n=1 Tax=Sclerotinia sclerotiorum (strain ATCC 18683 / 1980 / Ss-1) TaxID=665079 RepID=A7EF05_SCLS1|nr:predicted protein [Sclerotinia sclerotiorum 1980 UF-70]EDO01421.1 predicted protein [Sclerotinia sclerotiorum 1980 UF-70]
MIDKSVWNPGRFLTDYSRLSRSLGSGNIEKLGKSATCNYYLATNFKIGDVNELRARGLHSQISLNSIYKLQVTSYKLQVTSYKLPS